jgi:hypothetical protein
MKYLSSFVIILISTYLIGCKDSGTQVSGAGNTKYPANLNNEWEYQTTATYSYYNKSGGIDSTQNLTYDNQIIKVIKIDDSLKNYKELIKFEIYNKPDHENISYNWYLNSDTSFSAIAYNNAGVTQFIQPKRNFTKKYLTLDEYKEMIHFFSPDIRALHQTTLSDTILFYDIPRKVLAYPLSVGNTWVELYYPFYRERYINNYIQVAADNQQFECYEIKVKWQGFKTEINDYISLDAGLIKREIISDSILITTAENPDGIGFGKIKTTSTLVRKNF